ncbi:MAG: hypothetical protein NZM37_07175 [Sandaracinaceae bacterium]|nr:hypothetical protein [Sandaracinaceae bacterium]MDW8246809.1 hypothetical protein [Sandaracinaceae bacterium]
MGWLSIALGVSALAFTLASAFVVWVPLLGILCGAAGPLFAVAGIFAGATGLSQARAHPNSGGEASSIAGLTLNALVLPFSLLSAFTCGSCNLICTKACIDTISQAPKAKPIPWDKTDASFPLLLPPPLPDIIGDQLPENEANSVNSVDFSAERKGDETPLPPPPLPIGPSAP